MSDQKERRKEHHSRNQGGYDLGKRSCRPAGEEQEKGGRLSNSRTIHGVEGGGGKPREKKGGGRS